MKDYIISPFYSIENNKLLYLNQFEICELPKEERIREKILYDEGIQLHKCKRKTNTENVSILVLEPHPDDFALSALGYVDNGKHVMILNIFSKMSLDSFTWKNGKVSITEDEYEKIRLKEEELAIEEILGEQYISLREKSTRISNKDVNDIINRIIKYVEKILKQNPSINTVMVPMGIGMHPDHMAVYQAMMNHYIKQINRKIKVVLYPEYPYARCKKFYKERLEQIQEQHELKIVIKNIERKLDDIVNVVSVYKSQYDDINRIQMLAIIREDGRAIAQEYNKKSLSLVYYEIER